MPERQKSGSVRAPRAPKLQFRAECTVTDCGWKGKPATSQKRAAKGVGTHALEKHVEVRGVMVRRVVVSEIVED